MQTNTISEGLKVMFLLFFKESKIDITWVIKKIMMKMIIIIFYLLNQASL